MLFVEDPKWNVKKTTTTVVTPKLSFLYNGVDMLKAYAVYCAKRQMLNDHRSKN